MSNTRPPGPKTGLATPGCYAAPLLDCDGRKTTREHYLTESLTLEFGKNFLTAGLSWQHGEEKKLPPDALAARVLCKRHNNALDPLDEIIRNFFVGMRLANEGRSVGLFDVEGVDFERWAMKVLLGLVASGNFFGDDGKQARVPERYLRILFGEEEMPEGCGFFYVGDLVEGFDADLLSVAVAMDPADDPETPGFIFGVTIRLMGFQFITSVTRRLTVTKQRLFHRPPAFQLGQPERGRIRLRWPTPGTDQLLVLKMSDQGAPK